MVIGYAIKYLLFTCAASTALAIVLPEEPRLIRIPMTKQYDSPKGLQRKRSAKLYNDDGANYLVDVAVGTPPQVFELTVDTGSSDIWIPGSQCPDAMCPLAKFNEANSTTYKPTSKRFYNGYTDGNTTGIYASDTITIAEITVEQQQFGYISSTINVLPKVTSPSDVEVTTNNKTVASNSYRHMNGIFGLGFPFLNGNNPFFYNLKALNKISQNIFSIYMNNREVYGDSGEIILGGIDKTKYTGEIIYVPVSKTIRERSGIQTTDYGFWQVNGQGVGVANGVTADVKLDFQETVNLIFDTGSTYSRLPTNVFEFLLVASIGENNFSYNPGDYFPLVYCSVAKQNTTIQIMMSQSTDSTTEPVIMHIPLSDILFTLRTSATICGFGIVPVESRYVIGESLLRSLYQVYDAEKKRIGVAGAISSAAFVTSGKVDSNNIGGKNIGRSYL